MSLAQASSKLIKLLEKYSNVIKQERLIFSEKDLLEKKKKILLLAQRIKETICGNESAALKNIGKVLEDIHKVCMCDAEKKEPSLVQQQSILIFHRKRKIILSKNIPRPQIDFKDRESKHTLTQKTPEESQVHLPLNKDEIYNLYTHAQDIDVLSEYSVEVIYRAEDLEKANAEIEKHPVIGVDIKKHTFRSYKGFICYIQVCTPEKIYVFDMLSLRNVSEKMLFIRSDKIFKLMFKMFLKRHWIEKDMHCAVPLAVDIYTLSNTLVPASLSSLAQMVKKYLNVPFEKQFDIFDWRYRPMTQEAFLELKNSVHYLLPIFKKTLQLSSFSSFSEALSNQPNPLFAAPTAESFAKKYNIGETSSLKEVFSLRDFIAKQEDESACFILTDGQLCLLLKHTPSTKEEVFSLFPKTSSLFKANINNFLRLLRPSTCSRSFSMAGLKKSK